jgi:Undecaprenyl-phosphate galactose phosphotransferase WbaP
MGAKPVTTSPAEIFAFPQRTVNLEWLAPASLFVADLLTLSFVFGLAVLGRQLLNPTFHLLSCLEMLPCLVMLLVAFGAKGLYPGVLLHPAEEMRRVFVCISAVFLLMASSTFLWHNAQSYSRSVFLVSWAVGAPLVLLTRYVVRRVLSKQPWWGIPAVVLGSGPIGQRVVRKLQDGMLGMRVTGVLTDDPTSSWSDELPPLVGHLNSANLYGTAGAAQYCIVALPQKSNPELRHVIQDYCQGFRHVLLVPDMPGLCSLGISACELGGEVGFELPQRLFHSSASIFKRSIDITFAVLALLLVSPLFVLTAIAVKLTSRGPIFYGQTRLGKDGEVFSALKFRTMIKGADAVLADYLSKYPEYLLEWKRDHKLKKDPRVTKVGKWLRQLSLDELPQLINIITGHMSLVGPRPIVKAEIEKYGRGYELYSRVRPGLTGLWQVSGRNNTSYEERVAFDEYYVRNWSIWLDAYILICTIRVVLTAEGAY